MNLPLIKSHKSTQTVIKNWFFGGYTIEKVLTLELNKHTLSIVADKFINEILPKEIFKDEEIENLKGIEKGDGRSSFLNVSGVRRSEESEEIRFYLSIESIFKEFKKRSIFYVPKESRLNLPKVVDARDVARAFPLEITDVQCGVEVFKQKNGTGFFSSLPTVKTSIQLRGSIESVEIIVREESLKSDSKFPGINELLVKKTLNLLSSSFSINWEEIVS